MRLIWPTVTWLIALCGTASAQLLPINSPPSDDTQGWALYCLGAEKEISRQAVQQNNQLLFSESNRRSKNLVDEIFYLAGHGKLVAKDNDPWFDTGQDAMGRKLWDFAAVGTEARQAITIVRAPRLSTCNDLADSAAIYVPSPAGPDK